MKRWRFDTLLSIVILSTCLVIVSPNDDFDDDGVTIESEQIVIIHNVVFKLQWKMFQCINFSGLSKASTRIVGYVHKL